MNHTMKTCYPHSLSKVRGVKIKHNIYQRVLMGKGNKNGSFFSSPDIIDVSIVRCSVVREFPYLNAPTRAVFSNEYYRLKGKLPTIVVSVRTYYRVIYGCDGTTLC